VTRFIIESHRHRWTTTSSGSFIHISCAFHHKILYIEFDIQYFIPTCWKIVEPHVSFVKDRGTSGSGEGNKITTSFWIPYFPWWYLRWWMPVCIAFINEFLTLCTCMYLYTEFLQLMHFFVQWKSLLER